MIYSKNQRFFEILLPVFIKVLSMRIITTLLITAFISPVIKDTTRPVFNMYTISKETNCQQITIRLQLDFFVTWKERCKNKQR